MFNYFCVIEGYGHEYAHAAFISKADAHEWAIANSSTHTRYVVLDENNRTL